MSEIELKEFSVKDNEVSLGGLGMGVQQVGGGGITQETDPTVPQWAKQPNKPKYDYSEIVNTPNLSDFATKTEVKEEIAGLINSAPETLDTLGEIAKAIEDNAEVVDVLNQAIGEKASKTELQEVDQKATNNATAISGKLDKVVQTSGYNRLYGIANGSTDTIFYNLIYASRFSSETEAKRITGVPTYLSGRLGCAIPEGDFDATPKKWVLDQIANASGTKWYKHNILVNIQNVTYYNMEIITTSQTAIEYNGNGLIIQGAVMGTMYYGAGGGTSNELQYVGILLPFAETYYPTIIDFGASGLPEVKNFISGSFFPSDVTEFIDTPTEL